MKPAEFKQFLSYKEERLSDKSDSEKIQAFIEWCRKHNLEEIILRLSSEEKGGLGKRNYFLDFTTRRIIVSKKGFARRFLDVGYIAGMAPLPYLVLLKNPKLSDVNKKTLMNPEDLLKEPATYSIQYSDMQEFSMRKGVETAVTNMFGSMIASNFLTVKASDKTSSFTLPVSKNGSFEQIYFWLSVILPVDISAV